MERRIGKEEDDEWKRRKGAEEWGIGQRKREIVNELEFGNCCTDEDSKKEALGLSKHRDQKPVTQ